MVFNNPTPVPQQLSKALNDAVEAELQRRLGSYEAAREFAHLFILEETPIEFATRTDETSNEVVLTASSSYKLRLKTQEELDAGI